MRRAPSTAESGRGRSGRCPMCRITIGDSEGSGADHGTGESRATPTRGMWQASSKMIIRDRDPRPCRYGLRRCHAPQEHRQSWIRNWQLIHVVADGSAKTNLGDFGIWPDGKLCGKDRHYNLGYAALWQGVQTDPGETYTFRLAAKTSGTNARIPCRTGVRVLCLQAARSKTPPGRRSR